MPVDKKATLNSIKALKGLLEKADDDVTFGRFSELPPELRQIVFRHYFNSLTSWVPFMHQPPITLVSRSVRKDSLPLFFECCDFRISADADFTITPCKLVPDFRTAAVIQNTSLENFARIKSLSLNFHNLLAYIELDFRSKDNPVVSARVFGCGWALDPHAAGRQWLLSELRTLTKNIVARERPLKLRVGDIEEMCAIIRQA